MLAGILVVLLFLGTVDAGYAADLTFKAGLWEITVTPEKSEVPMQPFKLTLCLTKENVLPYPPSGFQDCKITRMEVHGSRVVWEWACDSEEGPAFVGGEMLFEGERLTGFLKIREEDLEVVQKLSGRWLRKCQKP